MLLTRLTALVWSNVSATYLIHRYSFRSWLSSTLFVKMQLNRYWVIGGKSPSINHVGGADEALV